jgi:hypothetical protein
VLTEASITGRVDHLRDVKENVIVGRLIPAGTGIPVYREIYEKDKLPRSSPASKTSCARKRTTTPRKPVNGGLRRRAVGSHRFRNNLKRATEGPPDFLRRSRLTHENRAEEMNRPREPADGTPLLRRPNVLPSISVVDLSTVRQVIHERRDICETC